MYKGFIKIETPRGSAFGEASNVHRTYLPFPLLTMRVRRAQVNSKVATLNYQGGVIRIQLEFLTLAGRHWILLVSLKHGPGLVIIQDHGPEILHRDIWGHMHRVVFTAIQWIAQNILISQGIL